MVEYSTITVEADRRDSGELRRLAAELKEAGVDKGVEVRGPAPSHSAERAAYCLRVSGLPEWVHQVASERTVEEAIDESPLEHVEYDIRT